jgi:hypothetical protein
VGRKVRERERERESEWTVDRSSIISIEMNKRECALKGSFLWKRRMMKFGE